MGIHVKGRRQSVQILIASSRAVTRRALKGLLQTRPDLVVVAEAADAQEMLEQAEANSPDVVLLDSGLFNGPQEDLVASLRQLECQPKVVVLGFSSEKGTGCPGRQRRRIRQQRGSTQVAIDLALCRATGGTRMNSNRFGNGTGEGMVGSDLCRRCTVGGPK